MGRPKKEVRDYSARDFSKAEEDLILKFRLQRDDARDYFLRYLKPRYDLSHKLYTAYNGDRAREIEPWKSNVFVPYTLSTIETLMPRILDARPDFEVQGRGQEDQDKAIKIQMLNDYTWEIAGMDDVSETLVRASLIYGISFLMSFWKKDVRTQKHLRAGSDPNSKKPKYDEKKVTFYDAPSAEACDNYNLWYDWRNIPHSSKQFWFRRLVLNGEDIRRRYPAADPTRLEMAFKSSNNDLTEYGHVRYDTRSYHDRAVKGAENVYYSDGQNFGGFRRVSMINSLGRYQDQYDQDLRFHEVFEWTRPFDDAFCVLVGEVPIFNGAEIPIPFSHKEAPFIDLPFLRLPFEYEGLGIPLLLEQPQLMLNLVKNQRLDNSTLAMHKMWIVNPLAGIKQEQLITRPFGIIYSSDPNGVRPVEFSDIKESAFREEELLKGDMRYASGVDDFSMGTGGGADSATEIRHLRESTLERVRLFINHMGSTYSKLMRHWISMYAQFMTKAMTIRVTGEDGMVEWPLIEKDDLKGEFDFKASVLPSIAGKDDIEKKQGMDLFQLLSQMPFIDLKKLTSKVLFPWGWSVNSISKEEEPAMAGMPPGQEQMAPGQDQAMGMPAPAAPGAPGGGPSSLDEFLAGGAPQAASNPLPPSTIANAMRLLGQTMDQGSPFQQASAPIALDASKLPPTAKGIPAGNTRGHNRTGKKVNTNLPSKSGKGSSDVSSHQNQQAKNIQK